MKLDSWIAHTDGISGNQDKAAMRITNYAIYEQSYLQQKLRILQRLGEEPVR
jgi:hypothetical protein